MPLLPGDPLPSIRAQGNSNPDYALDTAAGRYLLIANLANETEDEFDQAIGLVDRHRSMFDDDRLCFFGVVRSGASWRSRATDSLPGVRWLFDAGQVAPMLDAAGSACWILIDPTMRVMAMAPLGAGEALLADIRKLPPPEAHSGVPAVAPVLIVPRIFEPEFCAALIRHYDEQGGRLSGFMREVDGVTRLQHDPAHKRRSDVILPDGPLQGATRARIARRLAPQIGKVFQFQATRIERYLVAAYDSEAGGWFRPHRDNTTKGTAHRRFAVSINLNADFDGGDLCFPEYGRATYRPPVGGACVFSCSLLHEARPVTRGRRYAFLPFLYDEAAAEIRSANLKFLDMESLVGDVPAAQT